MYNTLVIARRELRSYFTTPLAYIFLIIFLLLSAVFTFFIGGFFARGQADLQSFFIFHPWLYLFLIPAVSMRLWAEERRTGTIELLLTLPISTFDAVLGKYLAAWFFCGTALLLTFPIWITVSVLGDPDHGVIFTSYLASFLMAGSFLAIGSCMSALTRNQVISFVLSLAVCFVFMFSGIEMVLSLFDAFLPAVFVKAMATFSFLTHFSGITEGLIDIRDMIFFISLSVLWLFFNVLIVDMKKGV